MKNLQADSFLERMADSAPQEVEVKGRRLRPGGRVRLRPHPGGDLIDAALDGRVAVIEGIDEDEEGVPHVAVTLEDDPGRDLAATRHPARRFFFAPGELDPMEEGEAEPRRRVLVAGIGNVFFGDDGFGVAVAQRLLEKKLPAGIEVADFGIRGMDLAYALGRPYHAAILVDAVPLGRPPGTLFLLEPENDEGGDALFNGHGMNPLAVLQLARRMGELPAHVFVVGCQPQALDEGAPESMSMVLSDPVAKAVENGMEMVIELAEQLLAARESPIDGTADPIHNRKGALE